MTTDASRAQLLEAIEDALTMLDAYRTDTREVGELAAPLPGLLRQCEELCAQIGPPPVRTLHHLASSGGTVISKCIAAMPNTILLSEIDPLSKIEVGRAEGFAPTDLLLHLRRNIRAIPEQTLVKVFQAGLVALHKDLTACGQPLVLRDHAHSQFGTDEDPFARPTLREIIAEVLPLRSVVTLRHPLDAFLSMNHSVETLRWRRFHPFTLEEYAGRVLNFLARHDDVPVVLYEDFVADPDAALRRICTHLELTYSPVAVEVTSAVHLSGDSGRTGHVIARRARRPIPDEIAAQRDSSPTYGALCARFGYTP